MTPAPGAVDEDAALQRAALRRVYEGELGGFVARRKEQALRARQAGQHQLAVAIARWPKPNQSLWAVNQWCWSRPEALEALQSAGGQLAAAVAGRGDLSVQEVSSARQRRLEQALSQCVDLLEQAGFGTTRSATDPIQRALEALSVVHLRPNVAAAGDVAGPGALTEAPAVPDFADLLDLGVTVDLNSRQRFAPVDSGAEKGPRPQIAKEAAGDRQRQQLRRRLQARLRRAREKTAGADADVERATAELRTAQRAAGRAQTLVDRRERQLEEARALQAERQDELETAERAHGRAELERDKTAALIRRLEAELAV